MDGATGRPLAALALTALALTGLPSVVHSELLGGWPQSWPVDRVTPLQAVAVRYPSVAEQWYDLVTHSGLLLLLLSVTLVLPTRRRVRALPWATGLLALAGLAMAWIAYSVGVLHVPGAAVAAVSYLLAGKLMVGVHPGTTGPAADLDPPSP